MHKTPTLLEKEFMTPPRRDGKDSPFGAWVRSRRDLDSIRDGITVNDIDWTFRKYKDITDSVGTRTVNLQLQVELKTHGARPNPAQQESLFCAHVCCVDKRKVVDSIYKPNIKISIWHLGIYVLILDEEAPGGDYDTVRWCNFLPDGRLRENRIPVITLVGILAFKLRPENPSESLSVRRHHASRYLEQTVRTPLGFNTSALILKKS